MRRNVKTWLLILMMIAMLVVSACQTTTEQATEQATEQTAEQSEQASEVTGEKTEAEMDNYNLVLGTAGSTGTYYIVGAAIANAITQYSPNMNVVSQATNGGVENLNLLQSGDLDFGFTNSDGAYWVSHGGGTDHYAAFVDPADIKGVMRLYESQGHMITMADSDIETYEDLRGKTVCLGPPSSTIPAMSMAILRAYGIDPETDINAVYYSIAEGLEKLTDGVIDATFFVAAAPTSGLINASATSDLKFVDADVEILNKVVEDYPYYVVTTTKEGAYPSMNSVNTLKIYTEIVTSGEVDDDAVYLFVKYAIEELGTYVDTHVACQEIGAESACITAAPLHPGAERYYREIGVID